MFNGLDMLDVRKKIMLFSLSLAFFFGMVGSASAQTNANTPANSTLKPCPNGRGTCTLIDNPLESRGTDIFKQVGGVVGFVLLLIGSVTLLMVVWGGFQWLTAAGNSEKIEQGSKTMLWAMVGVFAVFISYLLLGTYLEYLTGAK